MTKLSLTLLVLAIAQVFAGRQSSTLSVTNYGSLQISTVQHGEKYATNRPCYALEDVSAKYHGMTHVRGLNDKDGDIVFDVNLPVRVYLAVDSRYPYIHGNACQMTGDYVMLGGCHARTVFHIFKSAALYRAGKVRIHFSTSRMTAIFVQEASHERGSLSKLSFSFPAASPAMEISTVRQGEKFSTDRDGYQMVDIPPKYQGLTHVRGPNYNTIFMMQVNIPVVLYVAVDSRYPNVLPTEFTPTRNKIVHAGSHPRVDFPIYQRQYYKPGLVGFALPASRMLTVFVKPLYQQ